MTNENKKEQPVAEEYQKETKKKKSIIGKIFSFITTTIIFIWVAIAMIDFINVNQEKEPIFCIKKETIQYDDGTVELCTGPGYKVYKYQRKSIQGVEFGPFWIKEKTEPVID